ncbi:hypothetical protein ACFS5J_02745 [Flavobacterium chuncheonense]|uniref:Peptidyl-prolyl cis-trans isomerase n=1 Tax=Flavobacterium chuncheonense TaxID=2026653 RepID=A0ABW5YJ58_9FLAO
MRNILSILVLALLLQSCDYFKKSSKPQAVARVGDDYLYEDDLVNIVPIGTSSNDSLAMVKDFIDRWATQKLLYAAAEINLSESETASFNDLIEQYKIDLFTRAYLEGLVVRKIDTVVTDAQIVDYYNKNKQFFTNSNELVKLRYVNLVKENPKLDEIKSKFTSFTAKDKNVLSDLAIQFKSYAFNDSVWVDINQVFEKIPFVNLDNKSEYIKPGNNFQFADSTTVWLVKVREVLPANSSTPLQFIRPTIKQVIINNRKLELVKTIEEEITNDAIKNRKYEVYK